MADDTVQIQITAEVDSLVSGLREAQQAASDAFGSMTDQVTAAATAMSEQLGAGAETAASRVREVKGETDSLAGSLGEMKGKFTEVFEAGGIIAAGEALHKLSEYFGELDTEAQNMRNLSSVLSINVEQYQGLAAAASDLGVSQETAARGVEKLVTLLTQAQNGSAEARGKLEDMGLTLRQIEDPATGTADLIAAIGNALNNSGTAAAAHSAIIAELGPRYARVAEVLKTLQGEMGGLEGAYKSVNGLTEQQIQLSATEAAIHAHNAEELHNQIAGSLADRQKELEYLEKVYQTESSLHQNDSEGDYARKQLADTEKLLDVIRGTAEAHNASAEAAAKEASATAAARNAAGGDSGQLTEKQKQAALQQLELQIDAEKQGTSARLALEADYYSKVVEFYGEGTDKAIAAMRAVESEDRAVNQRMVEDAKKSADERFKAMEAAEKAHVGEQLEDVKLILSSADEYFSELDKQEAKQKEIAAATRETAIAQLEAQRAAVPSQGGSSNEQLAQQQQLIGEEIAAWHAYYDTLRQLAEGNQAEIQKLNSQELQQTDKLADEIAKAQEKAAKQTESQWLAALKPIGTAFGSMVDDMLRHSETFHQGMLKIGQSVLQSSINWMVQEAEKWAAKELTKTAATILGTETRTAATATGAAESLLIEGAAALKFIGIQAYKAAAGAFSAMASIPYVGPILAVAASAAAIAEVLNFAGHLAFEKGGIVPYDTMAQVHAGEMVLPRKISEGVQQMINTGGSGGGGSGGDHFHFHALDVASFQHAVMKGGNAHAIGDAAAKAARRLNSNLRGH